MSALPSTSAAPSAWVEREGDRGYIVIWHGYQHGGLHFNLAEARQHQAKLNEAPEWDLEMWLARHEVAS